VVGRRLVLLVLVLVVVVAGLAFVVVLLRDDGGAVAPETRREATVRPSVWATLDPPVHRFGERVTARIQLITRTSELVPQTARPSANFDPYTALGRARTELHEFGSLTQLGFTVTIQCLRAACLPEGQTGEFDFGQAGIAYRVPPPPGRRFQDRRQDQRGAGGTWPTLKVTSWLSPEDVQAARWRSSLADLPAPTYRVAPRWLVGILLGVAAALVLAAAALITRYVLDALARRARAEEVATAVPPLEQALALVEESRLNGGVDGRRVALETLAHELRSGGESGLAADAERLAWSPEPPAAADLQTLVTTVRSSLDGGAS
jgi:flagellar basal body-associated protein FliL